MRKVKFPVIMSGVTIVYPDDIALFANTEIIDTNVVGDYSGVMPLADYSAPEISGVLIPLSEFLELIGDANLLGIFAAAKTDPQIGLVVEKIKAMKEVSVTAENRKLKKMLVKLRDANLITAAEFKRILRREYLT